MGVEDAVRKTQARKTHARKIQPRKTQARKIRPRIVHFRNIEPGTDRAQFVLPAAMILIASAWCFVTAWYLIWGLWLVPYRLIRRGSRKRKREALQHREMIAAIQSRDEP